eukprot:gene20493-26587_t
MNAGVTTFYALVLAMLIVRLVTGLINPLLIVPIKFLLIGKYKPEQLHSILGKGFYRDDVPIIGSTLTTFYYRCLGVKIGRNVRIHRDAKLGQYDLLTIGDNVCIDSATIRPFAVEEGSYILLPIVIGSDSSISTKCIITPGSILPPGTCLGPLSSSYDLSEAKQSNQRYCRMAFSSPSMISIIFIGIPILAAVLLISMIPWFIVLNIMVLDAETNGWYNSGISSIYEAFLWWVTPRLVILIKRHFIGNFVPLNGVSRQFKWNRFKYWLMGKLLPGGNLGGVSKLVGSHYELISVIYRLLGAKVGKRVYWPGSGLDVIEFDLLDIGDDVTFGSRSTLLTSTTNTSNYIKFESGSMIADRCVILPGTIVHRSAVLGSGTLANEGFEAPVGSVWVGSRDGKPINVMPEDKSYLAKDTTSPFGRAFYKKDGYVAPYYVFPLWLIWILLGRRKPGVYSWDQSSYCQRWQLYLTIQEIRRSDENTGILNLIRGSIYLVWYFKLLGSSIGYNVCLYPNGGDPMMTEPDVVTIRNNVVIDDASLIAHINTRGIFKLNQVVVESNCVLKSFSRLLSGGYMDSYSILCEHSLVLGGERVDQGTVWQGWPNKSQITIFEHRIVKAK